MQPIPPLGLNGEPHNIPHIGWNRLIKSTSAKQSPDLLSGIGENESFYFVHSFVAIPKNKEKGVGIDDYNGISLSAIIGSGYSFGCQFHPEKSGAAGLKLIGNFLNF